ncbi:hypothetical protein F5884DRAFT_296461 [Xylogone sp. PMI_703]|nr:hypothetical protein F5884DRAFT_296461 [Xylogone sp. PMI_703]
MYSYSNNTIKYNTAQLRPGAAYCYPAHYITTRCPLRTTVTVRGRLHTCHGGAKSQQSLVFRSGLIDIATRPSWFMRATGFRSAQPDPEPDFPFEDGVASQGLWWLLVLVLPSLGAVGPPESQNPFSHSQIRTESAVLFSYPQGHSVARCLVGRGEECLLQHFSAPIGTSFVFEGRETGQPQACNPRPATITMDDDMRRGRPKQLGFFSDGVVVAPVTSRHHRE